MRNLSYSHVINNELCESVRNVSSLGSLSPEQESERWCQLIKSAAHGTPVLCESGINYDTFWSVQSECARVPWVAADIAPATKVLNA